MTSTVFFLALVVICGLMLWVAFKIEPHWASKDGTRFVCFGQALTNHGVPIGGWREMRIARVSGDVLEVRPRRGTLSNDKVSMPSPSAMLTRRVTTPSYWKVMGKTQEHGRKVIYMLNGSNDPDLPAMIAVRLPAGSRAVSTLEDLALNKSPNPPSKQSPGTPQSVAQPDRD